MVIGSIPVRRCQVFSTRILPHIIKMINAGYNSTRFIEQPGYTVDGCVVPELEQEYYNVIRDLKKSGFKTSVKVWENDDIPPPRYTIYVEWR